MHKDISLSALLQLSPISQQERLLLAPTRPLCLGELLRKLGHFSAALQTVFFCTNKDSFPQVNVSATRSFHFKQ